MDTLAFPFEIKSVDAAGSIEGLAAAFGNIDGGGDKIAHGAFTKSIAGRGSTPLPMLLHHDTKRPIGAWTELRETAEGLYAKGRLSLPARDAIDAHVLAKDGALSGLSIGYRLPAGGSHFDGKARVLTEVNLFEVSLVTFPMNDRARVRGLKNMASVRDLEDLLRDEGGLSSRKAKAAATAAWKAINEPDDEQARSVLADIFKQSAARIAAK